MKRLLFVAVIACVLYYLSITFNELNSRECVTSSDCKRLFPNNKNKNHCEVGIYKCVRYCSPTRHEKLIERAPETIKNFLHNTSNVWKKLSDFCQYSLTACIVYIVSWYSWFRKILIKIPLGVIATIIICISTSQFLEQIIKFFIPHKWIDIVLSWAIVKIQKFKNSLNVNNKQIKNNIFKTTEQTKDETTQDTKKTQNSVELTEIEGKGENAIKSKDENNNNEKIGNSCNRLEGETSECENDN